MAALWLASTSPYRRRLLERLGLPFAVEAPEIDEPPTGGEAPPARALRLARAKAAVVSARHPGALVLGSDQVAECAGTVLGKPRDALGCRAQLRHCSGRAVSFHTAAVLACGDAAVVREHVDLTTVRFRRLGDWEIEQYVLRDQPYDCAGGFRAESLGIALFESVETRDPTALVGLPLIWVAAALAACGLDPLSGDLPPTAATT
ncbi:MAG: Maf family protein [Gammaproteobacteria bacterium]